MEQSRNLAWFSNILNPAVKKKREESEKRRKQGGGVGREKKREIKEREKMAKGISLSSSTSRNMSIPDGSPDLMQTPKLKKLFKFPNTQLNAVTLLF